MQIKPLQKFGNYYYYDTGSIEPLSIKRTHMKFK